MCSSQNKRIISSGIYVANEKYSTKSKIVTPTLANCWCGIMIEEMYSGTLIPRIKSRALRQASAIPQTIHV